MATIQFYPPVYGAECVAEYRIKIDRGGEQVICTTVLTKHLKQTYNCMVPKHAIGYIFAVEAITTGLRGAAYHASSSVKCCK